MLTWIPTERALPEEGRVVETRVDGQPGSFLRLKLVGPLWLLPCGSFRVFYLPTHWRPVNRE
jgi:hypothetical protein